MSGQVSNYYRSIFDVVKVMKKQGLVVYGAGFWGECALKVLGLFGVEPLAFCDDAEEKNGISYKGYAVYTLEKAVNLYPDAVYFSAADNFGVNSDRRKMNNKLANKGVLTTESGFHPLRYMFLLELDREKCSCHKPLKLKHTDIKSVLVLNQTMSSGVKYFESLLDGSQEILNIPNFGGWCDLVDVYEKRLKYLAGLELTIEIMAQMSPCFKHPEDLDRKINERFYQNALLYNEKGERENRILVDPNCFYSCLIQEIGDTACGFENILTSIYLAYNNSLDMDFNKKGKVLLFHDHKIGKRPELYEGLFEKTTRVQFIYVIREPIQHIYSIVKYVDKNDIDQQEMFTKQNWKEILKCDMGNAFLATNEAENVRVIRFEDLKEHTAYYMQNTAAFLHIAYTEAMEKTTANNIPIFNKTQSMDGKIIIEDGRAKTAIQKKDFSDVFSGEDIRVLRDVFRRYIDAYYRDCAQEVTVREKDSSFLDIFKRWMEKMHGSEKMEKEWVGFLEDVHQCIRENNIELGAKSHFISMIE